MVKNLYEGIMEEIEMGEKTWLDDFSSYETMLPSVTTQGGYRNKGQKQVEIYWCKQFQTNSCELVSPHMCQIKPEESPVPILHICAYCWTNYRKRKEHMEVECPAKK